VAAAVVLAAAAATGGVVAMSNAEQATPAGQEPPANLATVERGKLSDMVSQYGTLTYRARPDGSPYAVINRARGTYTKLADAGDKIDCGDVLYRVNDNPVLLLCGSTPAYRSLSKGASGGPSCRRVAHARARTRAAASGHRACALVHNLAVTHARARTLGRGGDRTHARSCDPSSMTTQRHTSKTRAGQEGRASQKGPAISNGCRPPRPS
jgi:hypothetical protein